MQATHSITIFVSAAVVIYYTTTFNVWLGHWLSHKRRSPTRGFHMDGHHKIYPDSHHCRNQGNSYRGGKDGTNSTFALLPTLVAQAILLFVFLPWQWFALLVLEMCVLLAVINVLHEQFHVEQSSLERYGWFVRARATHHLHHDGPLNFMVADHFWDRLFGTFQPPGTLNGWEVKRRDR